MKDHDLLGKQDPYIIFELGSEKITTPPIKSGGTNCAWEESFTLIGRNNASDLTATVYNKNTLLEQDVAPAHHWRCDDTCLC